MSDSVMDALKESTTRIMKKMDKQLPIYIKLNNDIYREYNHMVEGLLKVGYSMERAMPYDNDTHHMISAGIQMYTEWLAAQADAYREFMAWYPQMYVAALRSTNRAIRIHAGDAE